MSLIENACEYPKLLAKDFLCMERADLVESCREGWSYLEQEAVNGWVDSMPQQYKDVLEMEGEMTGW